MDVAKRRLQINRQNLCRRICFIVVRLGGATADLYKNPCSRTTCTEKCRPAGECH
ncbi:unnamed protein product [Staurois parvus]|uniref:Uncharacterized protein n=1 Tax=Staurois parvus TaxID=386267 RepID=A0ABN9C0M4_9NEOB|nr:unnamed protein product [Staurois parvus]